MIDSINTTMSPVDWPRRRLADLTTKVGSGATPLGGAKVYVDDGTPFIRSTNVHFDGVRREDLAFINDAHAEELDNVEVQTGDVLLNITGASIGRVATAPEWADGARVNQHVSIIRPTTELHSEFLRWWIAAPEQQRFILEDQSGMTRQALTKGKILDFEIPLPPLPTQRRIAATLDTLTSHAQHANDYLTAIPPLIDKFRQSVLARAFTGELTADWRKNNPDVEPASQLLERIKTERRKKWIENYARKLADRARKRNQKKGKPFTDDDWQAYFDKKLKAGAKKYKEPEPVDPEKEDLPEIPETWEWVRLEQLGELVTGSTPKKSEEENYGEFLPFIKPTELDDGRVSADSREKLSETGATKARVLPAKSILVTCIGATIGKTGLALVECATNQQINAVIPLEGLVANE